MDMFSFCLFIWIYHFNISLAFLHYKWSAPSLVNFEYIVAVFTGALFLDGGIEVADRIYGQTLFNDSDPLLQTWKELPLHPLQEDEPNGDRHWIKSSPALQVWIILRDQLYREWGKSSLYTPDGKMNLVRTDMGSKEALLYRYEFLLGDLIYDKWRKRSMSLVG